MVAPTSDTGGSASLPAGEDAAASSPGAGTGCRLSILVISVTVLRNGDLYGDLQVEQTLLTTGL